MCGWKQPCLCVEVARQNGRKFSIMVWGCLCFHGVGTLCQVEGNINSDKYIDILDTNLWPVIVRHFPDGAYLFQDDNAPVHRSRITQEYIARNRIKNMSWPAQSPDINIIENIWLYIKRKLQSRIHNINSSDELFQHTLQIWQDINLNYVRNLYNSIPRRIQQVIRLKGHLTKYWGKFFISLQVLQMSRRFFCTSYLSLIRPWRHFFLNTFVPPLYMVCLLNIVYYHAFCTFVNVCTWYFV